MSSKIKFASLFVALAIVLALVGGVSTASAQTVAATSATDISALQALIASLQAQIAALTGGATAPAAATSFTRDLTIGSRGDDVSALQTLLESKGVLMMPAGVAKGYFGALTKSALAKYQASVGLPATGYFGPLTRGQIASSMATVPTVPTVPGTTPTTPTTSGTLQGGAGSIEDTALVSGLNNEEVGEDEEDVEVAGLEVEVDDGSDIEITAVRIVFDEGTGATSDFDDYASEVSILVDGKEFARLDADEFNDDNDWSKTISLNNGAIIRAGGTGEIVVAVSGISNMDSDDQGDEWDVDFTTVRFRDASGASISETITEDVRAFSFEAFATAADTEFKITNGDDAINDAHTIAVDSSDDTDDEPILSYEVEIEGSADVTVDSLPVGVVVTGASNVDDLISGLTLLMDGKKVGSANLTDALVDTDGVDVGAYEAFLFDDLDLTLEAGETYEFTVTADLYPTSGSGDLDEGDTIAASTTDALLEVSGYSDIEDETGEDLAAADITGSASSDASAVYENAIQVALVTGTHADFEVDGDDNDYTQLTLKFDITAFGEDIYIPNVATDVSSSTSATGGVPTTAQGVGYHIQLTSGGIASTSVAETLTSTAEEETNSFLIEEGDTETFTLVVTISNAAAPANADADQFRAVLTGIGFGDSDSATADSVFTSDLTNVFKTTYGRIAN
ncbi:MAG: peptidoglycan-binding protein [Candidatus Vogelbacteria bacterium]|nr:peptidoglycan-binding protein [Candidatus Vogelbacteria bacterium]